MIRQKLLRAVCLAALICWPLAADAGTPAKEDRYLDAVLDIMPDMDEEFETVAELIRQKCWDRLLEKLGDITEEAGDTVWSPTGKVYISVRDYIRRLIISLPPEGLKFYRRRFDPEARGLLKEGVDRQDVGKLDDVDRKYPASTCAVEALDAAASILIDRGRYGAAAARLERLLARPLPSVPSRQEARSRGWALAKLGFCLARLGDDAGARATIARVKKLDVLVRPRVGGSKESAAAFLKAVLARGGPVLTDLGPGAAWPGPGGHPSHARPMLDVRPHLSEWWWVKVGDDSKQPARNPRSRYSYYPYGHVNLKMQASPLPVTDKEGVVYINTGKGLFALDHITGRRRWVAKPASPPVPTSTTGIVRFPGYDRSLVSVWHQWPGAASASVGGGKIFAVETMGQGYQLCLALSAFDASSGKRLWSYRQRPDGAGFEDRAYFPWAPTYVDGQVIGVACHRDQMFLCSLDSRTGKINWKVFLSADPVRTSNIYGRRTFTPKLGQPVVIADGVAYAATGMGAVAAVDVRGGELYWIAKYKRSAIKVIRQTQRFGGYTQYQHSGGWKGGFPVVSGGKLYVAPWDSDSLLVYDCRSGLLSKQLPRRKFTHFAGCHKGDVILVGSQTVAMNPQTGKFRWLVPTPFELQGMPVVSKSSLLIPKRGGLCVVQLTGAVTRRLSPVKRKRAQGAHLPLGNIVSCEGRLIAVNKGYVSGYFSYDETRSYLTKLIEERPHSSKPLLDRADLCYLHKKYASALGDLLKAEQALDSGQGADGSLRSRLNRMMFETRLRLSETDRRNAVAHIDAGRKYIFNEVARARFHLARGAALAAVKRYPDAVEEYMVLVEKMGDVKLEEDEASARVGVLAQGRIGDLVEKHGTGIYARLDARLRPQFDAFVRTKDIAKLRELSFNHPHSSLADNCLLEMARVVSKGKFGLLRAQTLLRSLVLRYPRSDVLGEAYAMLLSTGLQGSHYRMVAFALQNMRKQHPSVKIPWEGKTLSGRELYTRLMAMKEIQRAASALTRVLPALLPPLRLTWKAGSKQEALATVVSDDNCFDRGIGIAANVAIGTPPYQYYGRITRLRAFHTTTGDTLWSAKVNAHWCYGDIELGYSPWRRGKYRAVVLCSGNVVALCHPEGMIALDLATGREVWRRKWKRPASRNPMQWFDPRTFRVDHRLRQVVNQRPAFSAEAGRMFVHLPDGTLTCVDAATGKDIWKTKHTGYACGGVGLFGQLVLVAGVSPNKVFAYNVLNGQPVYAKAMPGPFPSPPVYDRARNRIVMSDGMRLFCYAAADFKQLWRGSSTGTVQQSQPWSIQALADGRVAVVKYVRSGNYNGYGLAMHDGSNGKELWKYAVTRYKRDKTGYTRTNMIHAPVIARSVVFVPSQTYKSVRQGKRYSQERSLELHVIDRRSGKKLRSFSIQPKSSARSSRSHVQVLASVATAEHAILISRQYGGKGYEAKLSVISGQTGKEVLAEKLPSSLFTGTYQQLMYQRLEPVVTVDGSVLVPNGNGLTSYGSAGVGAGPGSVKPKGK